MKIVDTHCHIQFKAYEVDRDAVIEKCREKNTVLNVIGTQSKTSKLAVELAEQHEHIYASIGLHPIQEYSIPVKEEGESFQSVGESFDEAFYDELAQSPKVIGVGETGLDKFHIPKDKTAEEIFNRQKEIFLQHYRFAQKHDLPLVIHVRDAHEEMVQVLSELETPVRGVVHCFTGNWEIAQKYLEKGLYLGFTGVVTFPAKKTNPTPQEELLEVLERMPIDRMLVETDAPFLAPQAYRGKRSEPWMVEEVAAFIAKHRQIPKNDLKAQLLKNTKNLFTKLNI